jgi:hypothetical protein
VDILLDHGLHVSGGKGVEIKRAVDRNPVRHAPGEMSRITGTEHWSRGSLELT